MFEQNDFNKDYRAKTPRAQRKYFFRTWRTLRPRSGHALRLRARDFSDAVGGLPLLQHPVALMWGDSFLAVANYIAQHGLCVTAQDRKFPTAGQFGVGELQRKVRRHNTAPARGFSR